MAGTRGFSDEEIKAKALEKLRELNKKKKAQRRKHGFKIRNSGPTNLASGVSSSKEHPALMNVFEQDGGMFLAVTLEDKVFVKRYMTLPGLKKAIANFDGTTHREELREQALAEKRGRPFKYVPPASRKLTEQYLKSIGFKFYTYTVWSDKKTDLANVHQMEYYMKSLNEREGLKFGGNKETA